MWWAVQVFARGHDDIDFPRFVRGLADLLKGDVATRAECTLPCCNLLWWRGYPAFVPSHQRWGGRAVAYQGFDPEQRGFVEREDFLRMLTVRRAKGPAAFGWTGSRHILVLLAQAQFDVNMNHVKEVIDNLDEELVSAKKRRWGGWGWGRGGFECLASLSLLARAADALPAKR
jgi:hypothetical protein